MPTNIFVSWSGQKSKILAESISRFIKKVVQSIDTFYSPEIEKGTAWLLKLKEKLETTNAGIICLTPDNLTAPWLLYEAGALSKIKDSRVIPILYQLNPSDVGSPLSHLQSVVFSEEEMKKVLRELNSLTETPLKDHEVLENFAKWWPDLIQDLKVIDAMDDFAPLVTRRDTNDILEEILTLSRTTSRQVSQTMQSPRASNTFAEKKIIELMEEYDGLRYPADDDDLSIARMADRFYEELHYLRSIINPAGVVAGSSPSRSGPHIATSLGLTADKPVPKNLEG